MKMNRTQPQTQVNAAAPSSFFLNDSLDLPKIGRELYRHIWIMLAVSLATFTVAFIWTFSIKPQYQSAALIQIKSSSTNNNMLTAMGYKGGGASETEAQLALIRTRYILEPVVVNNHFNISIKPHYFPLFGAWMASHHESGELAKSFMGLKKYGWGGENVQFKSISIPATYLGQTLRFVAQPDNTYQLFSMAGKLILTGKVGKMTDTGGFKLEVSELIAHPGTEFFLSNQSPIEMTKGLAHDLMVTNVMGTDPFQSTGIAQLQLTGSDPVQVVKMLNAIVDYTVSRSVQRKSRDIEKTLSFLNYRLPELKSNLHQAESSVNQYHSKNTTLSMTLSSQMLVKQMLETEQAIAKLDVQKEEFSQLYTEEHPVIITLGHKRAEMVKHLEELKEKVRSLPLQNQEEIDLTRNAKIKNGMYVSLLNNQQQLEVMKAGLTPDVNGLTDATPAVKMPTHKSLIMMMGFLSGLLATSFFIIIKTALSKTIETSEEIEEELQLTVRTVVPFSRTQKRLAKAAKLKPSGEPLILAKAQPDDIAIESLRSLRVSLHMSNTSASSVIALTGSLSNIGKSFVSLNFAQIVADSGKRTLLIDADLRKGLLHQALSQPKSSGLSEYLEGKCQYEGIARPINNNFFFIPSGTYSNHPLELFQHQRFLDLLNQAKQEFDQIIIDTPPVLPVTDALIIAQHCDMTLFVIGASSDAMSDVKQAVKKAYSHGINIDGVILNHTRSSDPYGSRRLEYKYSYGSN